MGQTVKQCLARSAELPSSDSARLDTELLLCAALGRQRTFLYGWPDHQLEASQLDQFNQLMTRRVAGEPVAHLLGYREFWGLRLAVNNTTLIPRPDTEVLVEQSLQLELPSDARVLDLGTGTGAVALALATERPRWQIIGVDSAEQAVLLAESNRQTLALPNVDFSVGDWFDGVGQSRFDLIVSNPPYIPSHDPHLTMGDVRFEPNSALISGEDGLDDIRLIVAQSPQRLEDKGWLTLEHGYDQSFAVQALMKNRGFQGVCTFNDYGGNPRVTLGQWLPDRG